MYSVQLELHRRTDVERGAKWKLAMRYALSQGTYDLTKEYDSAHEALQAFANFARKGTVESSGETEYETGVE